MRIYVCDDNDLDRERILKMLRVYAGRFKSRIQVWKFKSAKPMLTAMKEDGIRPDLVFLDIYMEEIDGIKAGEKLRNLIGGDIPIIFSTSSEDHAIQAFQLRAAGYLHKPYTQEDFDHALKRVEWMFKDSARYLEIWQSEQACTCKIWLEDVLWLESEGRGTRFYLADRPDYPDKTLFTTFPLKTFRDSLRRNQDFYECGRSCILHLTWTEGMEEKGVRMKNGALIPVPVRLKSETAQHLKNWRKSGSNLYMR